MTAVRFARIGLGMVPLPLKALAVLILGLGSCFVLLVLLMSFANLSVLLELGEQTSRSQTILVAGQLGRAEGPGDHADLDRVMAGLAATGEGRDLAGPVAGMARVFGAEDGEVLAAWPPDAPGDAPGAVADLARRAIETSAVQEARLGDLLIVAAPVFGEALGPAVGAVSIVWNQARLRPQLLRTTLARGALGLASALALILAVASVIRRLVLRPISALAEVVERILVDGDTTHLPTDLLGRRDEIGRLTTSFQMLLAASNEQLTRRRKQLDAALEHMSQGLSIFDGRHRLAVCNRRFVEIYGLAPEATAPGAHLWDVLEAHKAAGHHTAEQLAAMEANLATQIRTRQPMAYLDPLSDGRVISVVRVSLPDGGWVSTFEDVTQRRRLEVQLAHMAHHDMLTGLPNRAMFRQELEIALAGVTHRSGLALFYLDLDGFKRVNDTLGHPVGDELLQAVAGRLRACQRPTALVARLGGDEFAILERDLDGLDSPGVLADRVIEALGKPFDIAGHRIATGTSVGIAMAPHSGRDPETLVHAADMALYRAKTDGRGCYRYARDDRKSPVLRPDGLELQLRHALSSEEIPARR